MKAPRFEIVNHGPDHAQYFQGCGTSHTPFSSVVTGIGDNAHEAYEDCVDQIYQLYGSKAEALRLPQHPRGIRKSDGLNQDEMECEEYSWYVSVRFTIHESPPRPRHAYITKRDAPPGYVAVTRPYARELYEQGYAITLCGNHVNNLHVFGGWSLGHTIQRGTCKEHYAWQESFDHICQSFLSYLEHELGTYAVYYVKASALLHT